MHPEKRLELFPDTVQVEQTPDGSRLFVGGFDLEQLVGMYGTPLYVYDAATIANAVHAYRQALADFYPGGSALTYAGKAYLCTYLAGWLAAQDVHIDCTGVGEFAAVARAGVPRAKVVAHGVNKSANDLKSALVYAGVIVVDQLAELERLTDLIDDQQRAEIQVWLRYRPGKVVATHAHIQTGQADAKFGMSRAEVEAAAQICRSAGLNLRGLHFHLGSHFRDLQPVREALQGALELLASLGGDADWILCPGGGLGVPYHEADPPVPSIREYVQQVAEWVVGACAASGQPLPRLHLEPGRSLVARAGLALYRVESVKQAASRRWLLVDGGIADNPRPALYGVRYSALPVRAPERPWSGPVWIGGPYCESGDVLIETLPMADIQPGELLAVPVSGAYQLSMASNYNGACRPAVVWLQEGGNRLIQRRETAEDLLRRDLVP